MTEAQKAQFLAAIKARLGILNADDLAPKMAVIENKSRQHLFRLFSARHPIPRGLFRVTGPTLTEFRAAADGWRRPANIFTICIAIRPTNTAPPGHR